MIKKFFKFFIYISLVFLVIALYRADYLKIPKIYSLYFMALAVLFCFAGFLADALAWGKALCVYKYRKVSFLSSIVSMGLSIFGKYIPGKIWVIAGRAAYIASKYNYSFRELSSISFNAQFVFLWAGLLVGAIGILSFGNIDYWGELVLLFWLGLSLIIFTRIFHNIFIKLFKLIIGKDIELPGISIKKISRIIVYFFLPWLLWSAGFYFLAESLTENSLNPLIGVGFPLAATFGVIAVVMPGGLGVREGVITGFLVLAGLSPENALIISITSRLWYLLGEFFIFLLAIIIKRVKT